MASKPTVTVVPGSVEEKVLKAQYGNAINIVYGNSNQFTGADRAETNAKYQAVLGKPVNDAGDLWSYDGTPISGGSATKNYRDMVSGVVNSQNTVNQLKADNQALYNSQQAKYDQLAAQQESARLGQISTARQTALAGLNVGRGDVENSYTSAQNLLNQQKNQAGGQYQALRNNTQVQAVQNSQKLKEIMAAQGLFNSGGSVTGQLQVDTAKQNAFNQINSDEQNLYSDIGRRLSDVEMTKAQELAKINQKINGVNSASSAEEAAALADIGAQRTKAQLELDNTLASKNQYAAEMEYNMNRDWLGDLWKQKMFDQTNADNQKEYDYRASRDAVADSQFAQKLAASNSGRSGSGYGGYAGKATNDSLSLASDSINRLKMGQITLQQFNDGIDSAMATGALSPDEGLYIKNQAYKTPIDNYLVNLPQKIQPSMSRYIK